MSARSSRAWSSTSIARRKLPSTSPSAESICASVTRTTRPWLLTPGIAVIAAQSTPWVRAVRDRMQLARREASVAERLQQLGRLAEQHARDLAPHGDHLVAVVGVGHHERVRPHAVEDREVVERERPGAA